jgi:hypothetical protein
MKSLILFLSICFIMSGLAFSQESTINPEELIVGKWKASGNIFYEFTVDKKVIKQNKEYATYRFLEGVLYLTYIESCLESVTGLKFENAGTHMTLTEYADREDSMPLHFKRLEE